MILKFKLSREVLLLEFPALNGTTVTPEPYNFAGVLYFIHLIFRRSSAQDLRTISLYNFHTEAPEVKEKVLIRHSCAVIQLILRD